jgi:hypothetical protein
MKSSKNTLCCRGCRAVSNTLSRINPTVPTTANTIVSPESTFSPRVVLGARRPLWRSHQSAPNETSSSTVVSVQPAINSGFRVEAPTSLM